MIRNKPSAAVYGIDLGKNVFHVVGTDAAGNLIQRARFRRDTLLAFLSAPNAHWWGWKPAQVHNGWQGSCRRSDIRSG